jgi:hypothetical protein
MTIESGASISDGSIRHLTIDQILEMVLEETDPVLLPLA